MYYVNDNESTHEWDKKNLVTIPSRKGGYDKLQCKNCGIKAKRFTLGRVEIPETYKREKAFRCPKAVSKEAPKKIKVIFCTAHGKAFGNIIPESEHEVITPPQGYKNDRTGVWVMGVGEPVKLLSNEYKEID